MHGRAGRGVGRKDGAADSDHEGATVELSGELLAGTREFAAESVSTRVVQRLEHDGRPTAHVVRCYEKGLRGVLVAEL